MKPNILILHADQHRQDCIGAYGNPDVKTPNIDSLCDDGVKYNNHYTVYPVCTPSRYSFVSGLYTHEHCAWTNESTLPNGFDTFPKLLRENGYRTQSVGKMHMTPTYQDVGYEQMTLAEQNGDGRFEDDYHSYLKSEGLIDAIDLTDQVDAVRKTASKHYYDHFGAFESDLDVAHHSTSWITRQAIDKIGKWDDDGGNLLMVGYIKPHHPFDPPFPYSEMYDPQSLTILDGYTEAVSECDYRHHPGFFDNKTLNEEKLRRIMANYYGTITQIDDNIGEILSLLKKKGLYENTLIIYTSDHGEYLGYHHMLLKGNYLYDPLAKIPLIIKYPKELAVNGISDALSENVDIATTILSCCGLKAPDGMHGIDLHNYTKGRDFAFSEGQYGTMAEPCYGYMIRSERYKLIVHGSFDEMMFFDLENDKTEQVNLVGDPRFEKELKEHQQMLIHKLLFEAGGVNHCDKQAFTTVENKTTQKRSKKLKRFIQKKLSEYQGY